MLLVSSFKPREYQTRIASSASQANTLVVLPTGLGKTAIAALVTNLRLQSYMEGKILILAPTRPLTLQHYNSFKDLLAIPSTLFAVLTGEMNPEERVKIWTSARLIFATPQTVMNDLKAGRASLQDFVLVVFDEAHRCVRDYSYTELARWYIDQAQNPLILGLTASPGSSKSRIDEIIGNLRIKGVEARSDEDEDVRPYIQKTETEGIKVKLPEQYALMLEPARAIYSEKIDRLQRSHLLPQSKISKRMLLEARSSILARLGRLEKNNGMRGPLFGSIINQAQAVMVLHAIELIETQGTSSLDRYLRKLKEKSDQGKALRGLRLDKRWQLMEQASQKLISLEHPKMAKLYSIISEQLTKKRSSRIIIFAQYRDTVDAIVSYLSVRNLNAQRFVGQADRMEDKGMNQRAQSQLLEEFKRNTFNILVSSSIGEEGLNIPDVDLVTFYEAVPSEIRSIQRRGRTGRTMPGKVFILLTEGTVDESYYYSSLYKEKVMKQTIANRTLSSSLGEKSENKLKGSPTLLDYLD